MQLFAIGTRKEKRYTREKAKPKVEPAAALEPEPHGIVVVIAVTIVVLVAVVVAFVGPFCQTLWALGLAKLARLTVAAAAPTDGSLSI